jgi:hypothetical protein
VKIPAHLVFSPSWWFHHYEISFREAFYMDPGERIRNDVLMRRVLWERFHYGCPEPKPRPVIRAAAGLWAAGWRRSVLHQHGS